MKKILYIAAAAMLMSATAQAQSAEDALRFSQNYYSGTARFTSMGGAFGALGGDFASLSVNPAGVGVYRTSEVSVTPMFLSTSSKSTFGNETKTDKNSGDFNFGYVQAFRVRDDDRGLVSFNIGIGYNTQNRFDRKISSYNGNVGTSFLDIWTDNANANKDIFSESNMNGNIGNNFYPNEWSVPLAWQTYLFDKNPNYNGTTDNNYYNSVLSDGDVIGQRINVNQRGHKSETVLSFGGNVSNKLYFGVTFGFQDLNFKETRDFDEDVMQTPASNPTDLQYFSHRQNFETDGTGYNAKFGLIVRPVPELRIGAAFHTPTYMRLTDYYSADMYSKFSTKNYSAYTPENEFDYKLRSPMRFVGGLAYTISNVGLISVDYEYVDYTTMKLSERYYEDRGTFDETNQTIKDSYKGASIIRVGAEARLTENFSLRAGYAFYESPYLNYKDAKTQIFSGGLGYRYKSFFIDAAYSYSQSKDAYNYGTGNINDDYSRHKVVCTLGFKF